MDQSILQLNPATTLQPTDLGIIVDGGGNTLKFQLSVLIALVGSGGGSITSGFTINIPGNPLGINGHVVNIGDSISALLKLIFAPTIAAIVSAGSNQSVALHAGLTIGLTATETAGTYPIATRLWSIVSGPGGLTINNPSLINATLTGFTSASAGTYQIKYHTVDTNGGVVDSIVTDVVIYNAPGIVASGVNIQLPVTSGNLTSAVTVTAGSYAIASTVYSFVSGPVTGSVTNGGAFSGFTAVGNYTCNVLVTDVNGHTSSTNIIVAVAAAAIVPIKVYYGSKSTAAVLSQAAIEAASFINENPGDTQYTIPYPGAGDAPMYRWFAELSSETIKTNGVDTLDSTNTFTIGGSTDTYGPPVTVGPYRFYITTYATALNPTIIKD